MGCVPGSRKGSQQSKQESMTAIMAKSIGSFTVLAVLIAEFSIRKCCLP